MIVNILGKKAFNLHCTISLRIRVILFKISQLNLYLSLNFEHTHYINIKLIILNINELTI